MKEDLALVGEVMIERTKGKMMVLRCHWALDVCFLELIAIVVRELRTANCEMSAPFDEKTV